jgi:hypothetical protein
MQWTVRNTHGNLIVSHVVDIYHMTRGAWSTAHLSLARERLVATSLPNLGVAFFAGGYGTAYSNILCLM